MENKSNAPFAQNRDTLFQVSLLQCLTYGDYCGSITVGELKQHGDTGIGTFNRLNGEMILLDGRVYRAAGDGSVEMVSDDETVPFGMAAFLEPDETGTLQEIPDFDALCGRLNRMAAEKGINRFYMIRIDGLFREVNVRSVYAQQEPYQRLAKVMEHDQTFFDYKNIEGTLVGLYCPPYMASLNAVGWHLHFVSGDKTKGGHVLGVNIADAVLNWDNIGGFRMLLPQHEGFNRLDLTVDQSEDIKKIETNKHS